MPGIAVLGVVIIFLLSRFDAGRPLDRCGGSQYLNLGWAATLDDVDECASWRGFLPEVQDSRFMTNHRPAKEG